MPTATTSWPRITNGAIRRKRARTGTTARPSNTPGSTSSYAAAPACSTATRPWPLWRWFTTMPHDVRDVGTSSPSAPPWPKRNTPFAVVVAGDDWLDYRLDARRLDGFRAVIVTKDLAMDGGQRRLIEKVRDENRLVVWPGQPRLDTLVPHVRAGRRYGPGTRRRACSSRRFPRTAGTSPAQSRIRQREGRHDAIAGVPVTVAAGLSRQAEVHRSPAAQSTFAARTAESPVRWRPVPS